MKKGFKIFSIIIIILILSFAIPIRTEEVNAKTSHKFFYNIYGIMIYSTII